MLTLALLWVLLVGAEGFLYSHLPLQRSAWRSLVIGAMLFGLALSTGLKLWADWQIWALFCAVGLYRGFNLVRFWYARLPEDRLRSVSIRAHVWLVAVQAVVLLVGSAASHWGFDGRLLDVIVAIQLAVALVLLRATTHTWRHATAPVDGLHLTDKELPSLSVLVPARNETVALDECLQMLTASDYPKLEILVLDDCSANTRTPEIIRSFAHAGVRFISGEMPDESHWLAKNYAYQRLAIEASGEVLLFCGVDAILQPQSMRRLVEILEARGKNMLSVMPLRKTVSSDGNSPYQAMRYYWELCLPRRLFKRPPVLSTCWLVRAEALRKMGGFEAVSHAVIPEASFARQAVTSDTYSFIRSDDTLGVYSNKTASEQYATSVRVRYPQLHRRLELVALATIMEGLFLIGPLVGLVLAGSMHRRMEYMAAWGVSYVCLLVTYSFASVGARLTNPWYGWLLMPVAFVLDLVVMHISLFKYEFGTVDWKGRNVCLPVMQLAAATRPAADQARSK